jgi:hypothetical protein
VITSMVYKMMHALFLVGRSGSVELYPVDPLRDATVLYCVMAVRYEVAYIMSDPRVDS